MVADDESVVIQNPQAFVSVSPPCYSMVHSCISFRRIIHLRKGALSSCRSEYPSLFLLWFVFTPVFFHRLSYIRETPTEERTAVSTTDCVISSLLVRLI